MIFTLIASHSIYIEMVFCFRLVDIMMLTRDTSSKFEKNKFDNETRNATASHNLCCVLQASTIACSLAYVCFLNHLSVWFVASGFFQLVAYWCPDFFFLLLFFSFEKCAVVYLGMCAYTIVFKTSVSLLIWFHSMWNVRKDYYLFHDIFFFNIWIEFIIQMI